VRAILVHLCEELLVALLATVQTCKEDASAVNCEESPDAVELGGEDLQHDEGEGELAEGGPDVGAFEGALGCADFLELVDWSGFGATQGGEMKVAYLLCSQYDRASSVKP